MAIPHAQPGEVIDVRPLANTLASSETRTLIKTSHVEVIRMVFPAGKIISEHKAHGEIIVQCLEGDITFTTMGEPKQLRAGDMLYWRQASHTLSKQPKILPSCSRLLPGRTEGLRL